MQIGLVVTCMYIKREEDTVYNTTTVYSYTVIAILFTFPLMFKTIMFHIT